MMIDFDRKKIFTEMQKKFKTFKSAPYFLTSRSFCNAFKAGKGNLLFRPTPRREKNSIFEPFLTQCHVLCVKAAAKRRQ